MILAIFAQRSGTPAKLRWGAQEGRVTWGLASIGLDDPIPYSVKN